MRNTILASIAMAVTATSLAAAQSFTYQGRLDQNGLPANGEYDFAFRVYDVASGGVALTSTNFRYNVDVVDGLFSVTLDFGSSVFNGDARYLDIQVRETTTWVTLTPRQVIRNAPYATFAEKAGNSYWEAAGNFISNTNQDGFVGINRNSRVSANEFFGIYAPVTSGYGGMYIETEGAALPFYGYSTPDHTAWTYLSGSSGTWTVYNDGSRLSIANDGNVGIGDSTPDVRLDIRGTDGWNLAATEGDVRIGNSTYRMKFGVATGGVGAGTGRIYAAGGDDPKLILGTDAFDVLAVTVDSIDEPEVGIGTNAPSYPLHVVASSNTTTIYAEGGATGVRGEGLNYGVRGSSDLFGVYGSSSTGTGIRGFAGDGIAISAQNSGSGTQDPTVRISNTDSSGIAIFSTTDSSDANAVFVNEGSGDLIRGFSGNGGGDLVFRVQNNGTAVMSVAHITGGSDLAEKFDVACVNAEPGMVVEIDPDNVGKLRIAQGAYNRRVAGIISGANGVNVGMTLAHLPGAENPMPIALSGRVWVYCDASERAVEPGDLLTTADRAGYAMPVAEFDRANGAVIGKAMSTLAKGEQGMVLVLVNLQ